MIRHFLQFVWDDEEEIRYREWLREQDHRLCSNPADWSEQRAEREHMDRLRHEAEEMQMGEPVAWEDGKEKEFRRKYLIMR